MSKGLIASLAVGLAIVVSAAGCGSEGGSTAIITKSEFIKQAEAVCARAEEKIQAGLRAYEKNVSAGDLSKPAALAAAQAAAVKTILTPAKREEAHELDEIGAPEGEKTRVEAIVASLREGVRKAEINPQSAIAYGNAAFEKWETLVRQYGLTGC